MVKKHALLIQSKNNNIIQKSSSGGMFAELAKYVLSIGGIVFGCTMERIENGFDIKHIFIKNENELYKLQGSKYVQSRLNNTIKEAKDFLDSGRLVLFSGTPCQIAGLNAYLKQDYDNLITVDLSCTGTPSLEIFNEYIKILESKYKQKVINFEFRNKEKMGWACGNALITLENGKQKLLYNNISSYLNLFINKKLQKVSCQNCKFSGLERISDITVADAWGVDIEYPEILKSKFIQHKGISLVLINSKRGKDILEKLENNVIIHQVNIHKLQKYNNPLNEIKEQINYTIYLKEFEKFGYEGIERLYREKLGKRYYYNILKNHTPNFIKKIIKKLISKKKKIDCILYTMIGCPNYGSLLTAYALQKTINDFGYTTKHLYWRFFYGYNKNFIKKYLPLTAKCSSFDDFNKINKECNIFILGSDNLINLKDGNIYGVSQALLNFTENNKKRLMISGSIGAWDGSTKDKNEHDYIRYLLNRFDYVSTREKAGKEILEQVFNIQADWINDPVFYLEKQDYIDLTKDVKERYSDKIMKYVLYPNKNTDEIIDYYKQKLGLETVTFSANDNVKCYSKYKNKTVGHWLSALINSKIIITDSYHCVAFSLIFNKPFVCLKNSHSTVRFTSLFSQLGINIPLIESINDLKNFDLMYDKTKVNNEIDKIRNFAILKIHEKLSEQKQDIQINLAMQNYNREFMKNNIAWYKRNSFLYFNFVVPFIFIKMIISGYKK